MDTRADIFKLQIVTFVDALCFGLIYGFISTYVIMLGGDHLTVGTMAIGNLICSLLSTYIMVLLILGDTLICIQGKQFALLILLNTALVSHIFLVLVNSYWFTIFARYIYSLTTESKNLCRDLLLQRVSSAENEHILQNYNIINGAGFIMGPFISGLIFDKGFKYIGILAAILTFINIYVLMTVARVNEGLPAQQEKKHLVQQVTGDFKDVALTFQKCEFKKNWDIMALKYFYVSSTIIFYSKFTQILKHNFQANAVVIGFTYSYMNLLIFITPYYINNIKHKYNYSDKFFMEYALVFLTVSFLLICYSSLYIGYVTIYIPLVLLTSFLNNVWKELFSSRHNDSLIAINNSVGIVAGLTTPIYFGIICNFIGHHAVILLTVLPLVISLVIFNKYTKKYESIEESGKDK